MRAPRASPDGTGSAAEPTHSSSTTEVIVLAAAAIAIGGGFARHTLGLVLPAMTDDIIGSYSRAGWLGTINLGAYLVGILMVSFVSGRIRPVAIIKWGLAGTVAGLAVMAIAPSFGLLALGMALCGFFSAGLWIPFAGVVSGATTARDRGRALGLVVSGIGLSIVVASQLVNLLRFLFDESVWRLVWGIEAFIGLLVLVAVVTRLRPANDPAEVSSSTIRVSVLMTVPRWWAVTGAYAAYGFGYSVYLSYLAAALEDDAGFSANHAAIAYSLVGITSLFGGIVFGPWSDRVGRRFALWTSLSLTVLCILAIPLGVEPWVALSAATFGAAMTGTGTVVSATIGDHLEPRAMGTAFGMVTVIFGIAQTAGPYVGGWITETAGSFTPTFLAAAIATSVAVGFAWCLPAGRPAGDDIGSTPDRRA